MTRLSLQAAAARVIAIMLREDSKIDADEVQRAAETAKAVSRAEALVKGLDLAAGYPLPGYCEGAE
jgi:hypothetical protein